MSVDHEFGLEVAASFPLVKADAAFAGTGVEMEVRVVLLPRLVKSVVEVFEKFLVGQAQVCATVSSASIPNSCVLGEVDGDN
jgi:hypothetical protein